LSIDDAKSKIEARREEYNLHPAQLTRTTDALRVFGEKSDERDNEAGFFLF
jgi:hypothetical protein